MNRRRNDSRSFISLFTVRYHIGIFFVLHQVRRCFQFFCFSVAFVPARIVAFLWYDKDDQQKRIISEFETIFLS